MKSASLLLVALAAAALSAGARSQGLAYSRIESTTDQIAPNLYMLSGSAGLDPSHEDAAGGRIGVLARPDGILMVDAQDAELGDKVLAAIRRISAAPIRFLVNTHIHRDHTAGNAKFAKLGATIFAREELRVGMSGAARSLNGNPAPASDPSAIPVVTYGMGEPVRLHLNGEVVDLVPI